MDERFDFLLIHCDGELFGTNDVAVAEMHVDNCDYIVLDLKKQCILATKLLEIQVQPLLGKPDVDTEVSGHWITGGL